MARFRPILIALLAGFFTGGLIIYYLLPRSENPAQPQTSHALTIEKIQALGRLELLHYAVRDVATYRWTYSIPLTESRILLVIYGEAIICMDFARIRVSRKDPTTQTLTLQLPPPEVCQVKVDPEKSRIYDASFSIIEWWRDSEAHRVREALAQAQDSLRQTIQATFPRDLAYAQAKAILTRLLQEAGWQQVSFITSETSAP